MNMCKVLICAWIVAATLAVAQDQAVSFDAKRARILQENGRALSAPSSAPAADIVTRFLRSQGMSAATAGSLRVADQYRSPVTGLTHIRMEQQVAGLRVASAYVKAALNSKGEVVHLIQNVAPVSGRTIAAARIGEAQALRAALARLYPGLRETPVARNRDGNTQLFSKTPFFHDFPRVERVAILMTSGVLKTGFVVETWSEKNNLLHETLVDGVGTIQEDVLRTNSDSYNVFTIDPDKTPQAVVAGPGSGNVPSPAGWLNGGAQSSINIAGNNVDAYLDRDANNAPDPGGTTVTDGNFLTNADLSVAPTDASNQDVAVQNLFYLNNVTHDILYQHGFTEGAGNFQENNFGKGGRGGDSVNAEAQDGGGTDNANFATPRDGRNPRMQMFLWTGFGSTQVVMNAPASIAGTYLGQGAVFGPALTPAGITGDMVLANDGTGTATDACEALSGVSGKVVLADRGTCTFVTKVRNAQSAGAVAVVIANNRVGNPFTMGDDGTGSDITIPSAMIGQADGTTIAGGIAGANSTVRLTDPPPLSVDGDLDSDVVYHEYGHGLTWRMIGRMSGSLSGAIGEGMSDTLSVIFNENDIVGEYAVSDPALGIRTAPYTNYLRTYGNVAGTEVHLDGEVYGAIGWKMFQNFQGASISKDVLLDHIVDGMNFTPPQPSFEEMRDGILQSIANSGSGDACLVWDAFAHYGVGVGAKGVTHGSTVIVTESFVKPPECP